MLAGENLFLLKQNLKSQKIDHFILPNSDEFFLEYLPESEKRVQYISGFTGSNATIIFSEKKSHFFTDGRYTLQARNEIDLAEYEIFNIAEKPLFSWLKENLKKSEIVATDAKLVSVKFIATLQKIIDEIGAKLVFVRKNPIDEIWKSQPESPKSAVFFHDLKYSGVDSQEKRAQVLQGCDADIILFTKPESICWLLNIRASDIEFTPLLTAYAILFRDGKVNLFVDENRCSVQVKEKLTNVNLISPNLLEARLIELSGDIKKIQIDPSTTNYWLYKIIKNCNFKITETQDPTLLIKACKNKIEISGSLRAHEIDGLAVTKFLFWLEENSEIDEIAAEEKLLEFRKENPEFLYLSFNTISSFASNGAIIHYHSSPKTNKKLAGNSLYLVDSGGQYYQGTTDITRTIAIGQPTPEMIDDFTLVLKGHIALACTQFASATTGAQLDSIARNPLLQVGKNYDHGTGHGVGSFLSVHEGPCSISTRSTAQTLQEGMILSNEPGFYKENAYGIRIENLMLVQKLNDDLLEFLTLTLAPLDYRLINFEKLSNSERNWLENYHKKVFLIHKNNLNPREQAWLAAVSEQYKTFNKKGVDKREE